MDLKWEYEVYRFNNVGESLKDKLTEYGAEGWELVALHPQPPHVNLIFKRGKR